MRIGKKDRVDVKKFMEEMKANRTNRSFTAVERTRQNTQEADPRTQSKYRPESLDLPRYPPPLPPVPPVPYNFEPPRCPPPYAPVAYPRPDYPSSQYFAGNSPPYPPPHSAMYNYSQTYNSQVYPIMQEPSRHEQHFGGEMCPGYQQPRGFGSRVSNNNRQPSLERINSLQEIASPSSPPLPNLVPPKQDPPPEVAKSNQILEKPVPEVEPVEVRPEPAKKKRKPKEKKKTEVIEQVLKVHAKVEEKLEVEESLSISRKLDDLLTVERKKIEAKAVQEANFKQIMNLFNKRVTAIVTKHLTPPIVQKLTALSEQLELAGFDCRDDGFAFEVSEFEEEALRRIQSLS